MQLALFCIFVYLIYKCIWCFLGEDDVHLRCRVSAKFTNLFGEDRNFFKNCCALVIRKCCVLFNAEYIYRIFAEIITEENSYIIDYRLYPRIIAVKYNMNRNERCSRFHTYTQGNRFSCAQPGSHLLQMCFCLLLYK